MQTRHKVAVGGAGTAAVLALAASVYIPHWEGTDLVAHHNAFDPPGIITYCNGLTQYDNTILGMHIKPGMRFTKQECAKLLVKVLPRYWDPLLACIHVPMPLHRSNAVLSMSVNLGPATVCGTKPGHRGPSVASLLNAGRTRDACNYMMNYTRAAGRVLPGLENRRFKDTFWSERTWCLRED